MNSHFTTFAVLIVCVVAGGTMAQTTELSNFESGTLEGWTINTPGMALGVDSDPLDLYGQMLVVSAPPSAADWTEINLDHAVSANIPVRALRHSFAAFMEFDVLFPTFEGVPLGPQTWQVTLIVNSDLGTVNLGPVGSDYFGSNSAIPDLWHHVQIQWPTEDGRRLPRQWIDLGLVMQWEGYEIPSTVLWAMDNFRFVIYTPEPSSGVLGLFGVVAGLGLRPFARRRSFALSDRHG